MAAFSISSVYSLVMMAVMIGIIIQVLEDGIMSPSSLFFFIVAGQIVITGNSIIDYKINMHYIYKTLNINFRRLIAPTRSESFNIWNCVLHYHPFYVHVARYLFVVQFE